MHVYELVRINVHVLIDTTTGIELYTGTEVYFLVLPGTCTAATFGDFVGGGGAPQLTIVLITSLKAPALKRTRSEQRNGRRNNEC